MNGPRSSDSSRIAFVVAGMHRSGTSAMAKVLNLAGAAMPNRVIAAGEDNPRGFWEPRDMVALNDEILRVAGYEWNHIFSAGAKARLEPHLDTFRDRARKVVTLNYEGARHAVLKDPRTSLVSGLWRDALEAEGFTPVFVILVRHPLEVARSIAKRDGAPVEASVLAWLNHMVAIERDTRKMPRIFVSYDGLLNDWRRTIQDISRILDAPLTITDEVSTQIDAFLSKSERHHTVDDAADQTLTSLWPPVGELWQWAKAATAEPDRQVETPRSVTDALSALERLIDPVLSHQQGGAEREKAALRSLLGDREVLRLRAEARAVEYQEVIADLTRQQATLISELTGERDTVSKLSNASALQQAALERVERDIREAEGAKVRLQQEMQSRLTLQDWFWAQSENATRAVLLAALDAARTEARAAQQDHADLSKRFDVLSQAYSYLENEHRQITSGSLVHRLRGLIHARGTSSR